MNEPNPRQMELFDTSLRDGMQQPNLEISVPERGVAFCSACPRLACTMPRSDSPGRNQFVSDLTRALEDADTGAMKLALFGRSRGAAGPRSRTGPTCSSWWSTSSAFPWR